MAKTKVIIQKGGKKESSIGYPLQRATVGDVDIVTGLIEGDLIHVSGKNRSTSLRPSDIPKGGFPFEDICIQTEEVKQRNRKRSKLSPVL